MAASIERDVSSVGAAAGRQLQILVSDGQPAEELFEAYLKSQDKDVFVTGLVANLILRHKQWQAERRRGAQV